MNLVMVAVVSVIDNTTSDSGDTEGTSGTTIVGPLLQSNAPAQLFLKDGCR